MPAFTLAPLDSGVCGSTPVQFAFFWNLDVITIRKTTSGLHSQGISGIVQRQRSRGREAPH